MRVAIDRSVVARNYLYVKEDGIERRVKIDLDNTEGTGRRARYRVCIEDDEGEYSRCVVTDRIAEEFRITLAGSRRCCGQLHLVVRPLSQSQTHAGTLRTRTVSGGFSTDVDALDTSD